MADAPTSVGGDRFEPSDETDTDTDTGTDVVIDDEVVDDRPRWVRFSVAGRRFLVGVESVQEVLVAGPCTRLPGSVPAIVGVTSVRGRIVAVVDPRSVLHGTADRSEPGRLLVVRTPDGPVGLLVDLVDDVVPAEPEGHPGSIDEADPLVVANAEVDGDLLPVIDPVAVVARAIAPNDGADRPEPTTMATTGAIGA